MNLAPWTITLVGSIAALCTTAAFVPQVIRVVRLRSAEEISLTTFLVFSLGMAVWAAYGFLINSVPVILANIVTLALALTIVGLKLRYDWASRRAASPETHTENAQSR
jgi:MtN3 and saliva related transmembrane protein